MLNNQQPEADIEVAEDAAEAGDVGWVGVGHNAAEVVESIAAHTVVAVRQLSLV